MITEKQIQLQKICDENGEKVIVQENCAIVKYPKIFEMSVISIINTFEALGVKCGEYYYDDEMEDFIIPFIN